MWMKTGRFGNVSNVILFILINNYIIIYIIIIYIIYNKCIYIY